MLKILFRAIYKQLLGPLTMSHPLYLHGCKIARFLSMALEGWDYGLKGTSIQALHYLVPNAGTLFTYEPHQSSLEQKLSMGKLGHLGNIGNS